MTLMWVFPPQCYISETFYNTNSYIHQQEWAERLNRRERESETEEGKEGEKNGQTEGRIINKHVSD